MKNTLELVNTTMSNDFIKLKFVEKAIIPKISRINPVWENIRSEADVDFIQYLRFLQLEKEPNLMTLPSLHYYYYNFDELKNIKTLINLKKLNSIKSLGSFLQNVVRVLPQKSNFIGYFKNDTGRRSVFSFYQSTKFFHGLVNYLDSKTDRSLTKDDVSRILEGHMLKVIDITDINGMSYFCSQNIR